jgi:hypothetical protein
MNHLQSYKLFESISEKIYHGNRKGDFPPKRKRFAGAIFLTGNLEFAKNFAGFDEREQFTNGAVWEVIECEPIISAIKSKKYDGFEVTEKGTKNVAIFEETSIEKFEKIL